MELGLEGKVVVISGASRGIGRAVASAFATEGSRLAVCSRDRGELLRALEDAVPDDRLLASEVDVSDAAQASRFAAEVAQAYGRVDVLVNNAGAGYPARFEELDDAKWGAVLDQNLWTAIRLTRAVLPHMHGGGSIVNVAALSALRPRLGQVSSNVAKAGIVSLTKSLAAELGERNIRVNAVCPGILLTTRWLARIQALRAQGLTEEDARRRLGQDYIPLGRLGDPEEMAAIVLFLASEHAGYISGATIEVDGGLGACLDLRARVDVY